MKRAIASTLGVVSGWLVLSAKADDSSTVDFRRDINPIFANHCRKCHGSDKDKGGLRLHTEEAARRGGDGGAVLIPGDSANSEIVYRITTDDPDLRMPPEGDGLSEGETALLAAWIDQGAVWDDATRSKDYSMKLREVTPPPGDGNPIDRFLDRYFSENRIPTPELVTDEIYIRRVYFDVLGLPPFPHELDQFLADDSAERNETMVRRALDQNQAYVDHWMTFWSDHLQVGSSVAGAVFNGDHTAGPRDWLYHNLSAAKGYNYFVNDVVSGGFLDLYGKSVAPPGEETNPALTASMQSSNLVSHVFLGIQMKCASCHDSFIDRWRMEDAWGLANALDAHPQETVRCNSPTGTTVAPRFPFPEVGGIDASSGLPDRRKRVAALVVDGRNGLFHRTIANRIWASLFGRGLVEPLDEMVEQEPWDSDLLEWLAMETRRRGYDLKEFLFLLLTSDAYRYEAVARVEVIGESDEFVFHGPEVKRLTAEQFLDTLTLLPGVFTSPADSARAFPRAWRQNNDALMLALGRPSRDIIVTARDESSNILQALELMNGDLLDERIGKVAEELLARSNGASAREVAGQIHRFLLSRPATEQELVLAREFLGETPAPDSLADWIWVLLSLPDFQFL